MITLVPAETPVTTPALVIVATPVEADTHGLETAAVPDPVNVVVKPTQTLKVPLIVGGVFSAITKKFELPVTIAPIASDVLIDVPLIVPLRFAYEPVSVVLLPIASRVPSAA